MTPEAQRIALAEACGWTECRPATYRYGAFTGIPPERPEGRIRDWLPDYLHDLNVIWEAEQTLLGDDETLWSAYRDWLYVVCAPQRHVIHATAEERMAALLKHAGKWDDSK